MDSIAMESIPLQWNWFHCNGIDSIALESIPLQWNDTKCILSTWITDWRYRNFEIFILKHFPFLAIPVANHLQIPENWTIPNLYRIMKRF